jgi:FdhD protein
LSNLEWPISRWSPEVAATADTDLVAKECPVALVYNGISHAVMMATPADLEQLARGFSLTEGIVPSLEHIYGIEVHQHDGGEVESYTVELEISSRCMSQLSVQRRQLSGRTGCGLCGVESLSHVLRELDTIQSGAHIEHAAIDRAVRDLPRHQPLQSATGGVHAAAWCDVDGVVRYVFEDVGRHNALDKLLGELVARQVDCREGFVLMSSRGSYEIIQKAAVAGVTTLVTLSAPSALACQLAQRIGMTLISFARPGRQSQYC